MDEGYLALRWNNHNTIFTKILNLLREQEAYTDVSLACEGRMYPAHKFVLSTCSDYFKAMFSKTPCAHPIVFMKDVTGTDLESLLDFMYKGEVHVPQSALGSLLRTAEGLQVKGLAVPDDARCMGLSGNTASPSSPPVPTVPSFLMSPSKPTNPVSKTSYQVKRKRTSDKKVVPPKLAPRSQLSGRKSAASKFSKGRNGSLSMPELKRLKTENKIRNNNTLVPSINNSVVNFSDNKSPPSSAQQQNSFQNDETAVSSLKTKFKVEADLEVEMNDTEGIPEDELLETEAGSGEDEEEEETTDGRGERNSPVRNSEMDDNSSLPNSEISTAELLQVDLSEDGTQFIIGPGGMGGEGSRGSSTAGDEEGTDAPKKPFVCLLCGHTFTRRDNLANHLKTHTGDRPFMCQYCHKCFSRKDYLKQHERIHTGEKPYACEICSRAFTRKEGLTDHMRCHSDFKAFACETCGKSFKQKCGLRFHKRNYKH